MPGQRPSSPTQQPERFAGIPSDEELNERLWTSHPARRLVITPRLSPCIRGGTIDIRLGTKFVVGRRTRLTDLDPLKVGAAQARSLQDRHEIGLSDSFVVHPSQLVLACTLEYISLPTDLAASVIGRSTFGRAGLISATATHVHSGYKGCLTLELLNLGQVPITLRPAMRIAQLVFYHQGPSSPLPHTKYFLATGPEFPRMWDDADLEVLRRLGGSTFTS